MKPIAKEGDTLSEIDLPGLDVVRNAAREHLGLDLPKPKSLRHDLIAGFSSALSNVADGMANGSILGVNPVYGLYGAMVGPTIGGIFSSTHLMMVTTMAAASLSATQALGNLEGEARSNGLFALVVTIGLFQLVAGLLRLGRFFQFVSYSVITGFLSGVSVLLILNQIPDVTGLDLPGGVGGVLRLPFELSRVHLPTLALAAIAFSLALVLPRTPVANLGRLIAIVTPSFLVLLLGLEGVESVRDIGEIPSGILAPSFPPLSAFTADVISGAAAVALVILVQSAGVSQSVPASEEMHPKKSRDFTAIGLANLASGLFHGLPIGGSVSGTALNILYGARTRWAAAFAGLVMALIVQFLSETVGYITMPALGAILILAGATSINLRDIHHVIDNGWSARLAGIATFVSMLFFPIQAAVGFGVVLSAFFHIVRSASDISIVELVEHDDGTIEERRPPQTLAPEKVTVLDVYGNLFYAGAQTMDRLLPRPGESKRPIVVLRLRGHGSIGATLLDVLFHYAQELETKGGRLYLSGLGHSMRQRITDNHRFNLDGPIRTFEATTILGESTRQAVKEGEVWLIESAQARVNKEQR